MAKFTSQEVSALQGGGNGSAKEIYFKEWDPQRQSFPDSSNIERLRDFIKHVYVDRRYSGEKSFAPKLKMGEAEGPYLGGSRSPPVRPSPGGSPPAARTDIVDDWRREDRFRDGKKSEDGKTSDGGIRVEGKSPESQRDPDVSSPPIVRPVRDILGEKASPLRVLEPPKVNGPRPSDGSVRTQRTVSSSSLASSNGTPTELRTESSLIDFDAVPEPASTAQAAHIQQTAPSPSPLVTQPTSSNNNWANFDSVQEVKASHTSSSTNLLDVLSELSVPVSNVTPLAGPSGNTQLSPPGATAPVSAPISHLTVTPGGAQAATPGPPNVFRQWQNVHPQQNLFPITQALPPSFNQAVGGSQNNQPWDTSVSGNPQVLSSSQGSQSQVTHGIDVKLTVKKELPEDLFSFNYSSVATPGPGWFPAPQYGMGFNMQYNVPQPMPPAYPHPANRSNPFDVNESSPVQATTFPSMTPLQGALPNMMPQSSIIHRTSSLGNLSPSWMPTQSSSHPLPSTSTIQRTSSLGTPSSPWMTTPSSLQLSYGPAMPSGPFMGQAAPNMPPPPRQQAGGFGSFNPSQQQSASSFSYVGGNPFG